MKKYYFFVVIATILVITTNLLVKGLDSKQTSNLAETSFTQVNDWSEIVLKAMPQKKKIKQVKKPKTAKVNKSLEQNEPSSEISYDTSGTLFSQYKNKADIYLAKFPFSPIKSTYLASSAVSTYEKTGVLVPLELVLAQAKLESGLGKANSKNLFGLTVRKSTQEEYIAYYYNLVATKYLWHGDLDRLLNNYVNKNGKRYAQSPTYEKALKKEIDKIRKIVKTDTLKNE